MIKKSLFFILFCCLISCTKTSQQDSEDKYKNNFLKLAEFDCEGITSEHFLYAEIDGMKYCVNEGDTIENVIRLFHSFTTSGPSSGGDIGNSFNTIWFGLFTDFDSPKIFRHFYFESGKYPDTTTLNQIAADVFVVGKKWPMSGTNITEKSVNCLYRYSDFREGYNTFYYVSTQGGIQGENFLTIDNVFIERFDDFIYYNVEMSFEAELYMMDYIPVGTNLWAEVRNGKMNARFKVPI